MSNRLDWIDTVQHAAGEAVLDFSAVERIDAQDLEALERLAGMAEERSIPVALRAVRSDVYKALKLLKLSQRFTFRN